MQNKNDIYVAWGIYNGKFTNEQRVKVMKRITAEYYEQMMKVVKEVYPPDAYPTEKLVYVFPCSMACPGSPDLIENAEVSAPLRFFSEGVSPIIRQKLADLGVILPIIGLMQIIAKKGQHVVLKYISSDDERTDENDAIYDELLQFTNKYPVQMRNSVNYKKKISSFKMVGVYAMKSIPRDRNYRTASINISESSSLVAYYKSA